MSAASNSGKPWSQAEEARLARLAAMMTVSALAAEFQRSELAICGKMQNLRRRARGAVSTYAVKRTSPLALSQVA